MKVLVADDAVIMRRIIGKCITDTGGEVIEAEDGAKALKALAENPGVDAVFMDWNMPVMSGLEALIEIKKNPLTKKIPVIMATTEAVKEDIIKAIAAGASGYIVKPFQKEVLLSKLKEVVRK